MSLCVCVHCLVETGDRGGYCSDCSATASGCQSLETAESLLLESIERHNESARERDYPTLRVWRRYDWTPPASESEQEQFLAWLERV